ncbi:hypothetical protein GIB67_036117 [Kingdonia uniflora]|uniref:Uncharacterized protein n=1 Tax=Kingdonia uniflora TaxID=39325 RepID=A0A7J7N935_9MAGN|nr:hypothetical protein GIB67_036117 [Kingdonia uniflora]
MVEAKSFRKAIVPSNLLQNPSPGNLQSTRLALHVDAKRCSCDVYIASGCLLYKVEISMEGSSVTQGKEGLLIPEHAQVVHSSVVSRCPHRSEIQSVVVLEETDCRTAACTIIMSIKWQLRDNCLILGTVDSYGHLFVSRLLTDSEDIDKLTYSVPPRDNGVGEGSWAGLCFSPSQWSTAAVARCFNRSVDVYDQDIHVRSFHTLWNPSSLNFFQNSLSGSGSSLLAVSESCQLTIWDLRTKENGGCIQRIYGSLGDIIYSVCSSSAGEIAVGGADRTVTIYDPRKWAALSIWSNCSKYEITGLAFSSVDPNYMYVQGVDYEVFCGKWKDRKKIYSFRGDSNWLGFSKCSNGDVLGGWCDSGSIFVADFI